MNIIIAIYNSNKGTMTAEVISDNKFIINLTIDGTSFEGVEVIVPEPNKTLREQINRIVSVFELPVMDTCGNPMQFLLGQIMGEELVILELKDEDGREQCLMDYNVQSGDYLHLIPVPAYACPIPMEMEREWVLYCMNKK